MIREWRASKDLNRRVTLFKKKKKVHFGSSMEKGWHGIKVGGKKINLEAAAVIQEVDRGLG